MPRALHKFHFDSNRGRGGKREGERGEKERDRCSCGGRKMGRDSGEQSQGRSFAVFPLVTACSDPVFLLGLVKCFSVKLNTHFYLSFTPCSPEDRGGSSLHGFFQS